MEINIILPCKSAQPPSTAVGGQEDFPGKSTDSDKRPRARRTRLFSPCQLLPSEETPPQVSSRGHHKSWAGQSRAWGVSDSPLVTDGNTRCMRQAPGSASPLEIDARWVRQTTGSDFRFQGQAARWRWLFPVGRHPDLHMNVSPEFTDLAEAGDHSYGEPTAAELRPVFEGELYLFSGPESPRSHTCQRPWRLPGRQLHGPPRPATLPPSTAR